MADTQIANMQDNSKKHDTTDEANNVLAVRCINPKNTGLKTDKVYEVTESEYFPDCYILDVGWNWVLSKDMFELVGNDS